MKKIKHLNDCESHIKKINELIDAVNELSAQDTSEIKYYRCISKIGIVGQFSLGLIYKGIDGEIIDDYQDKWKVDEGCFEEVRKPKYGEEYWWIDYFGDLNEYEWTDHVSDKANWKMGNVFNSEESAKRWLKIINDREI